MEYWSGSHFGFQISDFGLSDRQNSQGTDRMVSIDSAVFDLRPQRAFNMSPGRK